MKVLITGASGFIGSHLTQLLLDNGFNVIGTFLKKTIRYNNSKLIKVKKDLARDGIGDVLFEHQPDHFIHAAAVNPSVKFGGSKIDFNEFNNSVTMSLVQEFLAYSSDQKIVEKSIKRKLINLSTYEIYGEVLEQQGHDLESKLNPLTNYASSKARTHQAIADMKSDYVQLINVVLSNNYGPWQSNDKLIPAVINKLLKKQFVDLYGDGSSMRTWTYIQDTCEGLLKILLSGKKTKYHLCSDQNASVEEVVNLLQHEMMKRNIIGTEKLEIKRYHSDINPTFKMNSLATEKELKWKASIDLEAGLSKTLDHLLGVHKT